MSSHTLTIAQRTYHEFDSLDTASTLCVEATAGFFARGPGATAEVECGDGTYSIGGADGCTPCPSDAECKGSGVTAPTFIEYYDEDDGYESDDEEYNYGLDTGTHPSGGHHRHC